MEYVVIETGGKQYKVMPGDVIEIDRLADANESVLFDKVLLHVADGAVEIGKPYISGLTVSAKLVDNIKGDKIRVARFTAKSRHRRVVGFRAALTRVEIGKISTGGAPKQTTSTSIKAAKTQGSKVASKEKAK